MLTAPDDAKNRHGVRALARMRSIVPVGGGGPVNDRAIIRRKIVYSVLTVVVALVLAIWFVVPPGAANALAAGGTVNPASWPRAMLLGIAICAGLLALTNALRYMRAPRGHSAAEHSSSANEFDNRKALVGILLLGAYVAAMPVVGFGLATLVFLLIWLPFGGIRKPHVIAGVAVVGTVTLLYSFVKVTTLPLDRGVGVFDGVTVSMYRVLGIY
jgi:putative tricarboxylic transport membrane protein